MSDVHERLAHRLDQLTNGYPATDTGVELDILEKIFGEEDAGYALKLRPYLETAEKIAPRFGKTVEETSVILEAMADRGQIGSFTRKGEQYYLLSHFIPGFWEYQVDHLDVELSDMFDQYVPDLMKKVGGLKPAISRVLPVNIAIDAELQILSYEDMRGLIQDSKSFQLMDCICRKKKDLQGKRTCDHTLNNCMLFLKEENALDHFHYAGTIISREKALDVLEQSEQEGLVHCTYNTRTNQVWVCNCCSCCCDLMLGLNEFKAPYIVARSNFVASLDQENCNLCGVCADERCPTKAIVEDDGNFIVVEERCIGCGVCVPACPTNSLTLNRREQDECITPPLNPKSWFIKRGLHRVGNGIKEKMMPHK